MAVDSRERQQLLELVYDVLPDGEAISLGERIESDPEIAEAYAEARTTADRLASAARIDGWEVELKRPDAFLPAARTASRRLPQQRPLARTPAPERRYWGRETSWLVGISAAVLLTVSLGGYYYHRGLLADIATDHLRLRVVGPSQLHRGVGGCYTIATTSVTGQAVSAQVELILYSADGDQLTVKERTDEEGHLRVVLPADSSLPEEVRLEIVAVHDNKKERIETSLAVKPQPYRAHLLLDGSQYSPGDVARWRLLRIAPFAVPEERESPILVEINDTSGSPVPGATAEGTTRRGVGAGEFALPADLKEGHYRLAARSLDDSLPNTQLSFFVSGRKPADADMPVRSEKKGSGDLDVQFYPEAGELAAGLENRVYFSASDSLGRPVEVRGTVVDHDGHPVATAETDFAGRGAFSFEPAAGQQYRLILSSPDGVDEQPKLPMVTSDPLTMTTGLGVFSAGQPLEFNVRSSEAGIPLVAAAECCEVLVGQQALVTKVGANPVEIALDEHTSGVIRLTLYDYRTNPPQVAGERLVYRHPARQLRVGIGSIDRPRVPGGPARLTLQIVDEKGSPTAAALGVVVVGDSAPPEATVKSSDVAAFLLAEELDGAVGLMLEHSPPSDGPKAAIALDRLLGTAARRSATVRVPAPLAVFDNLKDLQERYRESLESYRANRTRPQNAMTMLSMLGGFGLLLFVTMLAILNIPTGLRLWIPSVTAALVCLVIGVVLMSPERLNTLPHDAVAFASDSAVPDDSSPGKTAAEEAGPEPSNFEFREYRYADPGGSGEGTRESTVTLYWHPLLLTDGQGRATIEFPCAEFAAGLRVWVEAHTPDGRLGSFGGKIGLPSAGRPSGKVTPKR